MGRLQTLGPRVKVIDTRSALPPPKRVDPFYLSKAWRDLLDEIIGERGKRCEDPQCKTPRGPWSRIFGDHIVELQDGGARLDKRNVMLRCPSCHTRKTAQERARRHATR